MLDLAGNWSLADVSGDYAVDMTLPGDGISALRSAGAIPDPYFGRNEYGLRWICQRDWVAKQYSLPFRKSLKKELLRLRCLQ